MKKVLETLLIIGSMVLLYSCRTKREPYKVIINDEYSLRVIQDGENDKFVSVDEYYYTEDVYSGHIEINITIPEYIDGMRVRQLGRDSCIEIPNSEYIHDKGDTSTVRVDIGFAIICNSYFEADTTFDINITIEANLQWLDLEHLNNMYLLLYDRSQSITEIKQVFPCNLNFSITGKSDLYYTENGEIFYKASNDKVGETSFDSVKVTW